jgi:iron complex outermembrane recepter protein
LLGQLDLRLFSDYVRGKLTDGGNLPRITPLRFGAGVDWRRGFWSATSMSSAPRIRNARRNSKRRPMATHVAQCQSFYDLNVGALDNEIFLRATNLLDEETRRHASS